MAPRLAEWGTSGWRFLHCVTFAYPEEPTSTERLHMYLFLQSIGHVLPCRRCRTHCIAYMEANLRSVAAPALQNRKSLTRFLVDMHNDVNLRLKRPTRSLEDVQHEYEVECEFDWTWIVLGVVLSVVVVFVLARRWRTGRVLR